MREHNELIDVDAARRRKGHQSPGRRRAQVLSGGEVTPVEGSFAHIAPVALVGRESSQYDYMLMDKMISQILEPHCDRAGVAAAMSLGVMPLLKTEGGERLRDQLGARLLFSRGSSRNFFGVRFVIDGIVFQYGLASGASRDLDGDNEWVESLTDLITEWRPAELITGPFSRLARLTSLFAVLERPIAASRTLVRTAEVPGGMDLNTEIGRSTWHALANAAETDYRTTVTRLLTGTVYEIKKNRYPNTELHLPPGYKKVGGSGAESNRVYPTDDHNEQELVRHFIELCAGPATDEVIAQQMGELGWTSRSEAVRSKSGEVGLQDLGNPKRAVQSLYQHLPVYLDGIYYYKHEMPLPNVDEFHGLKIRRFGPSDHGYFEAELDFGMPEDGWHDPEMILRAIDRRVINSDERPTFKERSTIKPLAGLIRYIEDGWEYSLMSSDTKSYEFRRRLAPLNEKDPKRGFDDLEGEILGRFSAINMHRAVAHALRDLSAGVPSSALKCQSDTGVSDEGIAALEAVRDEALERAERGRREVLRNAGAEADRYRILVDEAQAEALAVSTQLTRARFSVHTPPDTTLDTDRLAALIVILEELDGPTDIEVHGALRIMVRKGRIVGAAPGQPLARLELTIDLRTSAGSVSAGPLVAHVLNRATGGTSGSPTQRARTKERNRRLVEILLLEESDLAERRAIWEQEGFDPRSYTRRMAGVIEPYVGPFVTSAIIDCPILDVRRAVLQPYFAHDLPTSENFTPEFQRLVTGIYAPRGFSWSKSWCPGGMARERQVLGFLATHSPSPEEGLPLATVLSALSLDESSLYRMKHAGPAPYGRKDPSSAPWFARLEVFSVTDDTSRSVRRVRLLACPHCGERTMTQPLRVPEVPGYLLCTNDECHKSLLSDLVFPDEYFASWDGPQSLSRRVARAGSASEREWFTGGGRVIVGTTLCDLTIPAPHAPRKKR